MVVLFSEEDMMSFGEYMISDMRKHYITNHSTKEEIEERLKTLHPADLAEWARLRNQEIQNND